MANDDGGFDWGSLGADRWKELGESVGASELQIKFSAARFQGATATGAARLAGYSGDKDSLRRAGYSALRSTAVQNLLELAAINSPQDAKLTDKEVDAKLAKLVRSPDAGVSLKAMELHAKRERDAKAEQAAHQETADPADYLNLIAETDPMTAARISAQTGVTIPAVSLEALKKYHCADCARIIADKIGIELEPGEASAQ